MKEYREITMHDVGKRTIACFGRLWLVSHFMGVIMSRDVGKRIFRVGDQLSVENDEQRDRRLNRGK
jgi:hypothetical protein